MKPGKPLEGIKAALVGVVIFVAVSSALQARASTPVAVTIPSGTANGEAGPGYSPSKITVVIGVNNTVTWTNADSAAHTVTPSDTPSPGSWSFGSGNMNPGQQYSFTFTVPGN